MSSCLCPNKGSWVCSSASRGDEKHKPWGPQHFGNPLPLCILFTQRGQREEQYLSQRHRRFVVKSHRGTKSYRCLGQCQRACLEGPPPILEEDLWPAGRWHSKVEVYGQHSASFLLAEDAWEEPQPSPGFQQLLSQRSEDELRRLTTWGGKQELAPYPNISSSLTILFLHLVA